MGSAEVVRKGWVVFLLTLRYLLTTRRGYATALLALVPILLTGSLAVARVATFDVNLFETLMVPLFFQVVLIFVALVQATALVRDEIEDTTIAYLLTRPISKPAILLSKYIGYLASVLVVLIPSVALSYVITVAYSGGGFSASLDVLGSFLAATALGAAAYGAFFLFLSVLLRRPLAIGLLFGFVWESIVGSLPGTVPKLSLIYYLKSVLKGLASSGPLASFPSDVSAPLAAAILLGFTIGILILTIFVFQDMEFAQKA
jgi:ABC-2 type transport system permease protein